MQNLTKQLQMQLASEGSSSDEIHAAAIEAIKRHCPSSSWSFIDVGCGNALFTKKVKKEFCFHDITAIDAHNYSNISAKEINFKNINLEQMEEVTLPEYDLISCIEVIEHLENPWQFLRGLNKILKPGGYLVITTPNPESFRSQISFFLRGHHCAFGERNRPAHKTALSSYDLKYMLKESFEIEELNEVYIANGQIPASTLKWKQLSNAFSGKRFSDNYLITIKKKALRCPEVANEE